MNAPLQTGSLKIATIMGIPIRVHFSWLIIFGLITWSLSTFYFPKAAPQLPVAAYWINGAVAALLLFVSVAFHELSHSFVALKYKLSIINITLFIFGGVAQMKGEPPSPKAEFRIAIAGPLSSFFLSMIFGIAYNVATTQVTKALFSYLAQLNLILGAFNLIPGFPMDGGKVVRAFLWKKQTISFMQREGIHLRTKDCNVLHNFRHIFHICRISGWIVADAHRLVPIFRIPGELSAGESSADTQWN